MLSFLDRFLKYTTTFGSDIADRLAGFVTYESCEAAVLKAEGDAPKPEPKADEAARALLAWALSCFLLMMVATEARD